MTEVEWVDRACIRGNFLTDVVLMIILLPSHDCEGVSAAVLLNKDQSFIHLITLISI